MGLSLSSLLFLRHFLAPEPEQQLFWDGKSSFHCCSFSLDSRVPPLPWADTETDHFEMLIQDHILEIGAEIECQVNDKPSEQQTNDSREQHIAPELSCPDYIPGFSVCRDTIAEI